MQMSPKKFKLIICSAILLIVALVAASISLLISINSIKNEIEKQNAEIEKLNNQIKYYEQIENIEQPDNNIIPGEEEWL